MTPSYWRRRARAVIDRVVATYPPDVPEDVLKKAIRSAYPFGSRKNHPYAMWRQEVHATLDHRYGRAPSIPAPERDPSQLTFKEVP